MDKPISERINKEYLGGLFLLSLIFYILLSIFSAEQIFLGLLFCVGLLIIVFISRKSIYLPFVCVFLVGCFQGLIEIFFPTVPAGNLKYGILLVGGVVFVTRYVRKPNMLRGLSGYIILMMVFYLVYFVRILIPNPTSDQLSYQISLWGVLNIPLVLLFYGDTRSLKPIYSFLRVLIRLGIITAIFGLFQFILGPGRLATLGIDVYKLNYASLNISNVTTLRVFSTFPSHYEFASFMVVAIISKLVLHLHYKQRPKINDIFVFFLLLIGLAITFNVTLWLTLIGCIIFMLFGWRGGKRVQKSILNKRILMYAILALISILVTISFVNPVRERVIGLFNVSPAASGTAGGSLYWRIQIFGNLINLIKEFPLGLGSIIQNQIILLQKSRGWFVITSDVYFAWLALIGGLPLIILYLSLFFYPLIKAFSHRIIIKDEDKEIFWGIFSVLLVGVLMGGFSNSALINSTPTNLLIWASIGVLLRMISTTNLTAEIIK